VGQIPAWSKGRSDWHVAGSVDGRWALLRRFSVRGLALRSAQRRDEPAGRSPESRREITFTPPSMRTAPRIEIQSALISKDNRGLNICIVPVPKTFLKSDV